MNTETWHSSFNPQKFLSRVNLDKLIEHNEAFNESKVSQGGTPCILCDNMQGPGILLNDKSYLCKNCFSKTSTIKYPQKYEELYRNYLIEVESKRMAFEDFKQEFEYRKTGTSVIIFAVLSLILLFLHIAMIAIPVILFLISYYIIKFQDKKVELWNKQRIEWEKRGQEKTTTHFRLLLITP